ncbi:TrkA family potassium uptake protein [Paraglaciecola aquimarina]|uniref:TrkA family potassium uptake protein n=1 Tax=Paraglaciecola aquimarina TaxID=1235557 RepID=A0ABU3SRI9_9ALTE|nr:TrkA family potassium uptake protein [Paraglaciecola aquimarina]MDU0352612.1 TrkA family potassium uptake protein [Paraglaciecola aquimarina]
MAQFAVIGLGRFGLSASIELMRLGNTVIGIDSNEKLVNGAADSLTLAAIGDATDEQTLRELNIGQCDSVLVAIGEGLEASILCVLLLKSMGIEDIWVKATSQPHHTILSKLGVSRIIHPEEEMGVRVAQSFNYPMVNQYMPLGLGHYIVEIVIQENCNKLTINKLLGKAVTEINPVLIRRRQQLIKKVDIDFILETNDSLVLAGALSALKGIAPEFLRP